MTHGRQSGGCGRTSMYWHKSRRGSWTADSTSVIGCRVNGISSSRWGSAAAASVRALRILEAMGIVEARVGSGRDSGSTVSGRATEALSNLLRLHMALSHFQLADLVEVRIQLERSAAARASVEAQDDDIRRLNALIDQMIQPDIEHARFHELDSEFHVTIARASHNALAADLMQALRDAVRAHAWSRVLTRR